MSLKIFSCSFFNMLYPNKCPYCGKTIDSNLEFCKECFKDIKLNTEIRSFVVDDFKRTIRCTSPFLYTGKVKRAIIEFKFFSKTSYANAFGNSIFRKAKEIYQNNKFDIITAIPLSRKSKKQRGFNQSEILAKNLSKKMKVPYKELIIKYKNNKPQHELNLEERKTNVKGIYKLKNKIDISGKSILLVDDIVTTGCTLIEASKVLLKESVTSVECLTLANAQKQYK